MTGMADTPPTAVPPHVRARRRTRSIKIGLMFCLLLLTVRLVQIQVIQAGAYRERARKQYEARMELPAARGTISDRNGKVLVSNTMYVSFAVDPAVAGSDRDDIAARFARVFNKPRDAYTNDMRDGTRRFVYLERGVKPSLSSRIPVRELRGVIMREEPKRLYHYDRAAGQLIGVTGVDNAALSGLEQQFDRWLRGRDGYIILQRDALRRTRPTVDYPRIDPVDGQNLLLTIDADIQSVVEEELERGVTHAQAEGGEAVVVDPATGEILAMATYPSINPNNTSALNLDAMRNRVISDAFEPGSIFKLVTASAVLENKAARLDEPFNAENGAYHAPAGPGRTRLITDTHPHKTLTFQEAVEQSSNIVMAKLAPRIGAEGLFRMARAYGFGATTGLELPAEADGELKKPRDWSATTLQSLAYGYEVSATAIQIVMAYAAVANNGVLMKPFVVHQVVNAQGDVIVDTQPQRIRPVVSPQTAAALTKLFEGVVERGTGTPAKVRGLRIAGKTGTSRQAADGRYTLGNYTASFVGYFPADDPKAVCLVVLDRPRAGGYYGGQASAPIFKAIVEKIRMMAGRSHLASPGTSIARGSTHTVPDVTNLRTEVASALLHAEEFVPEVAGAGTVVVAQAPSPGTAVPAKTKVTLRTNDAAQTLPAGFTLVPEVRGLTVRRAINQLNIQQLDAAVVGSGNVRGQSPAPGEKVRQGTQVTLRCEPRPTPAGNS
jgi:cell division protein FtsI (penicillin-binding protein 3)